MIDFCLIFIKFYTSKIYLYYSLAYKCNDYSVLYKWDYTYSNSPAYRSIIYTRGCLICVKSRVWIMDLYVRMRDIDSIKAEHRSLTYSDLICAQACLQ